jgi:uncharacterized membrane protein YhaH (DUF805 family)
MRPIHSYGAPPAPEQGLDTIVAARLASHLFVYGVRMSQQFAYGFEWGLDALRKYAVFTGRARRKEYWYFVLIATVIEVGAFALGTAQRMPEYFFVAIVALTIPHLAVSVRRLHDTGRSGWWMLISIVPFGSLYVLVCMVSEGTRGANRHGPDPRTNVDELEAVFA